MSRTLIIAETRRQVDNYAEDHDLPPHDLMTTKQPFSSLAGRSYDDLLVIGNPRISIETWTYLTYLLLGAGEEALDRLERLYTGKLPPPIDLPRKRVVKF